MYVNNIPSTIYSCKTSLKQVTINMTIALYNIWMFCIAMEHKAVATLKYFITHAKLCLSYFYWKALVKCFEFVLTLIPTNKIVSALWEFITTDLFNTKYFFSPRKKLNNIFFLRYRKILPFSYFGYFEHVWLLPSNIIMPICRKFDAYLLHAKNKFHP